MIRDEIFAARGQNFERAPQAHFFQTEFGTHALLVDGSRIFDVDDFIADRMRLADRDGTLDRLAQDLGMRPGNAAIDDRPPTDIGVRALSLAVAQKCNLACTYCYAQEGGFGAPAKNMPLETALASVDSLIAGTRADERINIAFMGGEPLVNRDVIYAATRYARERADARSQQVNFSITTNGTLLTAADADFFEEHGFAVTLSIDGPKGEHDRLRPFKNGGGSYERIIARLEPFLASQRKMQVTARVTVTPSNGNLLETLTLLLDMGFYSVGFSPMLAAPNGKGEMDSGTLGLMLDEMIACGREYERRTLSGERWAFANLATALGEIHRGTHRPYPCGAGAGYLGVSADGDFAACHRFVGDEAGAMGSLATGIDTHRKQTWLAERHVHRQHPCNLCWARYLCGGGCHHETLARGRHACDFIRGWLHYCLQAYVRLTQGGAASTEGPFPRAHGAV